MTVFIFTAESGSLPATDDAVRYAVCLFMTAKGLPASRFLRFEREKGGKPFLADFPSLHMGVTHTASVLAVAVADTPVGLDMEETRRRVDNRRRIAKKYFTAPEFDEFLRDGADDAAFLRRWVKKEAYVKYTGKGLKALAGVDTTALSGCFTPLAVEGHFAVLYTGTPVSPAVVSVKC